MFTFWVIRVKAKDINTIALSLFLMISYIKVHPPKAVTTFPQPLKILKCMYNTGEGGKIFSYP